MTTIRIIRNNGLITGVNIDGHSGYAEEGVDIVCAAITSAVRLTECVLNDELKINTNPEVKDGYIGLELDKDPACGETAQVVLSAFCRLSKQLSQEYPQNIRVMEENKNA